MIGESGGITMRKLIGQVAAKLLPGRDLGGGNVTRVLQLAGAERGFWDRGLRRPLS